MAWAKRGIVDDIDDGVRAFTAVLVRAPIESVTTALSAFHKAAQVRRDVLNNPLPHPMFHYWTICQLQDHAWTSASENYNSTSNEKKTAKSLSKKLKCMAMSLCKEDTGGSCSYALFESGSELESMSMALSSFHDPDMEHFRSLRRQLSMEDIHDPRVFMHDFVRSMDAYVIHIGAPDEASTDNPWRTVVTSDLISNLARMDVVLLKQK